MGKSRKKLEKLGNSRFAMAKIIGKIWIQNWNIFGKNPGSTLGKI